MDNSPQILVSGSSSVQGYTYDINGMTLDVWFKPKGVYRYFNVFPGQVSQVFDTSGSAGKKLKQVVKSLRYRKLQ